jgi:GNAT superfamily N-acetyltransferase
MALVWSDSVRDIDWDELSTLYRVAPLGDKSPAHLRTAFSNSMFTCFAYDDGRLVGIGRALADGIDCSYIGDVAVLPGYQGRGIGKGIMARLLERSRGHRKIILYAAIGKEGFYRQFGFKPMTTAMAIFDDPAAAFQRGYVREA